MCKIFRIRSDEKRHIYARALQNAWESQRLAPLELAHNMAEAEKPYRDLIAEVRMAADIHEEDCTQKNLEQ